MVTVRRAASLVALILGALSMATPVAGTGDHIARITLNGIIDQVNAAYIQQGLQAAADGGAAAAIIEIDSPGGELFSTDTIDKAILASSIPVINYVAPAGARAGSAATFVTLAGDVAAMAPSTVIGAASVVDQNGNNLQSTEEAKVTNDAVARIRELASNHGRNADWAESAVRNAASIGAPTAVSMKPPVVDILAANETELLAAVDKGIRADGYAYKHNGQPLPKLSGLPIQAFNMNIGQQLLHLLSDPNVAFILFTIGFYGILTELFHPNLISGSLGAIAIILAWIGSNSLPLNVGGLALILVGIALFVLELHFTSYGFLAVGGVVCFILGASALYTGVTPPGQQSVAVQVSPILLVLVLLLTLWYFYVLIRGVIQIRRRMPRAPLPIAALVGAGGTAQTLLAPRGIAYAGGETWSARTRDREIPPGAPIKVVGVDGLELIVEPAPAGETPAQGREAKEGPSNA